MGQSESHFVAERRTNLFINTNLTAAVGTSVMRMAILLNQTWYKTKHMKPWITDHMTVSTGICTWKGMRKLLPTSWTYQFWTAISFSLPVVKIITHKLQNSFYQEPEGGRTLRFQTTPVGQIFLLPTDPTWHMTMNTAIQEDHECGVTCLS